MVWGLVEARYRTEHVLRCTGQACVDVGLEF